MRKIEIVASDERLITPSGLSLVGQVLGKSDMIRKANRMRTEKRSQPQIGTGDILLTMIGLLTLGKSDFENVNEFHTDEEFYTLSLGLRSGIPSESSLRNRLDAIGTSMNTQILEGNISMFRECGFKPTALNCGCVPVDIDVSPFDNSGSHKKGVSRTYKNVDGYATIFAYIGTEGYLCNAELREGSQHCQCGTPEFLVETISAAKQMTDKQLLFRMDSGNDALENMLILHWSDPQLKFLIKHNFRRENRFETAEKLKSVCQNITHPREGKTVYIGSTWREVAARKGNKITVRMVCEQFHSEIKTDMGIERLPSGKFETNALILKLAMIAYNILRIIGTEAMKKQDMPVRHDSINRRRIRTIIDNLILIAGHLTVHARKLRLALGRSNVWITTFLRLDAAFWVLRNQEYLLILSRTAINLLSPLNSSSSLYFETNSSKSLYKVFCECFILYSELF